MAVAEGAAAAGADAAARKMAERVQASRGRTAANPCGGSVLQPQANTCSAVQRVRNQLSVQRTAVSAAGAGDLGDSMYASPAAGTEGLDRKEGDVVVLRPGLAERKGSNGVLRAGQTATVTAVDGQAGIELRREADGEELGDGFTKEDLATGAIEAALALAEGESAHGPRSKCGPSSIMLARINSDSGPPCPWPCSCNPYGEPLLQLQADTCSVAPLRREGHVGLAVLRLGQKAAAARQKAARAAARAPAARDSRPQLASKVSRGLQPHCLWIIPTVAVSYG